MRWGGVGETATTNQYEESRWIDFQFKHSHISSANDLQGCNPRCRTWECTHRGRCYDQIIAQMSSSLTPLTFFRNILNSHLSPSSRLTRQFFFTLTRSARSHNCLFVVFCFFTGNTIQFYSVGEIKHNKHFSEGTTSHHQPATTSHFS